MENRQINVKYAFTDNRIEDVYTPFKFMVSYDVFKHMDNVTC
jgi:hypothetical protein